MVTKINDPSTFFTSIQLKKNEQATASSLAKIASGKRINKAADDASSMTIADKLESQLRGISQSIRNANDNIAINQVADGALGGITETLQDMRLKALQATNASQSLESRQALQSEINSSVDSIKGILDSTSFNGIKLLDSNFINNSFATGPAADGGLASTNTLNTLTDFTLANPSTTTVDSVVAEGSLLRAGTTLQAGSSLGFELGDAELAADITTTQESTIAAGSTLGEGTQIATGSEIGGNVTLAADVTTTEESTLASGSVLRTGTTLAADTEVTTAFSSGGTDYEVGDVLGGDVTLDSDVTLTDEITLAAGTTLVEDSVAATGSTAGAELTTRGVTELESETTLASGSVLTDTADTNIAAGSEVGGTVTLAADTTVTSDLTLRARSTVAAQTQLANGSTVGGNYTSDTDQTIQSDLTLGAGSTLAEGTEIVAGTELTNDIVGVGNVVYKAGEVLENNVITQGSNYLENSQTLAAGSIITDGSVFAAGTPAVVGETENVGDQGQAATEGTTSLANIDVTTEAGAQDALATIDAALQNINSLRSDYGSRQNQASSEINNLRNSLVNISAAQSSILDVDLAEEVMLLNQSKVLEKAQAFALAQTGNINKTNMLDLLQG